MRGINVLVRGIILPKFAEVNNLYWVRGDYNYATSLFQYEEDDLHPLLQVSTCMQQAHAAGILLIKCTIHK